ncbi:uncharacterized protein LOC114936349 [Nylanderia fulva]|uniref:uncharacterized protein LOC114936349 n=1 Tax=Nylanderia fulva TaxID=613905 RepID=UPI0010FB7B9B|nr:uncharacterized protein LOC114936349 [Nylanderia fulva]
MIFTKQNVLCNTTFTAEMTVIKNHLKAQSHQRRSIQTSQQKIKKFRSDSSSDISIKMKEATRRFEIKLCAFIAYIAEHNIPLRVLDHLTPLIQNSVTDSDIVKNMQLKSTKGIAIIKNVLGSTEKRMLQTKLRYSLFSILIDECTDIAAMKSICIVIRFFDDEEGRVVSRLWDICQIFNEDTHEASADHLFNVVITCFKKYQISFNNVIGFASDGCNTMMGEHNSVASRIRTVSWNIYF